MQSSMSNTTESTEPSRPHASTRTTPKQHLIGCTLVFFLPVVASTPLPIDYSTAPGQLGPQSLIRPPAKFVLGRFFGPFYHPHLIRPVREPSCLILNLESAGRKVRTAYVLRRFFESVIVLWSNIHWTEVDLV